ncbi:MAG: DUF3592 domain-containing protein [Colwellia sp.]
MNLVVVFSLFLFGLFEVYSVKNMESWVSVRGDIVGSRLHKNGTKYYPRITYNYCYKLDCRTSNRISNNVEGGYRENIKSAEKMLGRLVGNGVVTVYVDPTDIDNVVMERKSYFIGGGVIIISLIGFIRLIIRRKSVNNN